MQGMADYAFKSSKLTLLFCLVFLSYRQSIVLQTLCEDYHMYALRNLSWFSRPHTGCLMRHRPRKVAHVGRSLEEERESKEFLYQEALTVNMRYALYMRTAGTRTLL